MLPIDLALFDARDRALPGREMAELNQLCRQIVELMRRPNPSRANVVPWPPLERRLTAGLLR
jgi:hypothetical protein